MNYGCIGEHLKHSFSKEIHNSLADYKYDICEIAPENLDAFMTERNFSAINVTIPYKQAVIKHLYEIDGSAKEIGAVNTIVNRGGRLYGYNTDFFGMRALILHAGLDISQRKVAILGTGGTSRTASAVAKSLGACKILRVGRTPKDGAITYGELFREHSDTEIIINTTPVGMFPNIFDTPISLDAFPRLFGVIDAVYNPLSTPLVLAARERGIPAEGGLYMLVAQAVRASEIFLDTSYPENTLDSVFKKIKRKKENIVLIGMPSCGKSTVGKIIAERLGREFIDTDALIEERAGCSIPEIFENHGEAHFRGLESEVIRELAPKNGAVIATGGGAILREENTRALRENGKIYFIDRPLELLMPTEDRPLASSREAIERRFAERHGIYKKTADITVPSVKTPTDTANLIIEDFCL